MKSFRPYVLTARLGMAVAASLVVGVGSLPGVASAAGPPGNVTRSGSNQQGHVDRDVDAQIAANPSATLRVIITGSHAGNDKAVRDHGGRVVNQLQLGSATVADVPASQLGAVAREPGVARISYDAPVVVQSLPGDPLMNCCDQLRTAYPLVVDAVNPWNAERPLLGTGVGVAVLDSGVNRNHPDFLGGNPLGPSRITQLLDGISFNSLTATGDDDNGHGTFVAGIIAGRGYTSNGSYVGIAPDANIISVKVSDSTGMAHVSDVIKAIEWVARHRALYHIRVLNLSQVSTVAGSYLTDMLDAAVELAWFQGLVVIVSAGNAGPNAPITSPANDPFVITVGATDDKGTASIADDSIASFSSYGTTVDGIWKPELVAPGRNIVSTLSSPVAPLALRAPTRVLGNGSYIQLSGTSASAPVVSGVAAQLLQARPHLKPDDTKWLLTHTALPLQAPGTGAGYPRTGAAVQYTGAVGTLTKRIPNLYLVAAYAKSQGLTLDSIARDNVSWDKVSRGNVSWDNVSWDNVSWDNVSWDNVSRGTVSWDNVSFLTAN